MNLSTAREIRRKVVEFGTKQNLRAMTETQREMYATVSRASRDAMRFLNNQREGYAAELGGIQNVADDYEISDAVARRLAAHEDAIQHIASELASVER